MKNQRFGLLLLITLSFVIFSAAQVNRADDARAVLDEFLTLYKAGDYSAALPKAARLVELFNSNPDSSTFDRANSYRFLGMTQFQLGETKRAVESLESGIAILEPAAATNDKKTFLAKLYDEAAFFWSKLEKADRALEYCRKAVTVKTEVFGGSSVEVADSLSNLAMIEYRENDFKKSFEHFRQVYEIRAAKLGLRDDSTQEAEFRCECTAAKSDQEFTRIKATGTPVEIDPRIIQAGVINGKATNLGRPPYPPEARASRVGGKIEVSVFINENGKVIFACAVSGNKLLHAVSEAAAYASEFSPTTLQGNRVKVRGRIIYNFVP